MAEILLKFLAFLEYKLLEILLVFFQAMLAGLEFARIYYSWMAGSSGQVRWLDKLGRG